MLKRRKFNKLVGCAVEIFCKSGVVMSGVLFKDEKTFLLKHPAYTIELFLKYIKKIEKIDMTEYLRGVLE